MRLTIFGISDAKPVFSKEQQLRISQTANFAGGNRHYKLVANFLPQKHHWTNIIAPVSSLFQSIRNTNEDWLIFASGDPLFFGIGNTLKREFENMQIDILPSFNSLQLLGHHFKLPYGEFKTISLTGRDWHEFDKALITGEPRLAILTDRKNTPVAIALRMLEYNYINYKVYYGEHLGGENEKTKKLSVTEMAQLEFDTPNCFYLEKTDKHIPQKGVLETDFEPLAGRPKMITKMPVRLTTLALMNLTNKHIFWDIGACTGSVSIEARLNYPHLKVLAFEKRPESAGIIKRNSRKFQTPGIDVFINDYLQTEKDKLTPPDAVFLGGYGGRMQTVLNDVKKRMKKDAILAFNSVSAKSKTQFTNWCTQNNYEIKNSTEMQVDKYNRINILIAKKR
jgi:precorrin-6Y C5,15-methyltransferase (decarboxylating)